MIYTLTLNPAIDYYMYFDTFVEKAMNRARRTRRTAGGKGINVSSVLHRLGMDSVALGFIGGINGDIIKETLDREGIQHDFIQTRVETRCNVKLVYNKQTTEANASSLTISTGEEKHILTQIGQLPKDSTLILSGSVPMGIKSDIYERIILTNPDLRIIVDTSGNALKFAMVEGLYMVKPNKVELESYWGARIYDEKTLEFAINSILDKGVKNVMVSLGEEGAVLANETGYYISKAPKGIAVNTVGAGDSMLAGYLYAKENHLSNHEALKYSIASGSCKVFQEGFPDKIKIDQLYNYL